MMRMSCLTTEEKQSTTEKSLPYVVRIKNPLKKTMRRMTIDNIEYNLEWSSRMVKTAAKIHETKDSVIIKLSSRLVTSPEHARIEILSLLNNSPNVYITDGGKLLIRGKKLGEGGFSRAYKCSYNLVMKSGIANLSDEISIHRILSGSKYVPTLYDTIGSKTLIMERFESTLRDELKFYGGDEKYLRRASKDIIDCLKYIHSKGIVHCDIKPSNVFVSNTGRLVLGDFGLARTFSPRSKYVSNAKMKRFGTLPFMSRDVHNRILPTRRADMESFGWVVVEMFGGRLPWRNEDREFVGAKKRSIGTNNIDDFIAECFKTATPPNCVKEYLSRVLRLSYNETPDYDELKRVFDG